MLTNPQNYLDVIYNIHPYAMHLPGGGEIQLLKYHENLNYHGCNAILHNIWKPALSEAKLLHHFHLVSGGIPFMDFAKNMGIKILISPNLWINETNIKHLNFSEIQRYYELADLLICNSLAEIENLARTTGLPVEKARVVYNGVDTRFSEPVPEILFRQWSGVNGPYLLNVANVEPRKNQLGAIKAVQKLKMPLVSIGRIRDQDYFKACCKESVNDNFIHLGPLNQMDLRLRSAFQNCAAFILPSFLETPGIAALEAVASGCPLVITDEGSAYEYFGDGAFYVNPYDDDSIYMATNSALTSKNNSEFQMMITERFSWTKVTAQLADLYKSLIIDQSI